MVKKILISLVMVGIFVVGWQLLAKPTQAACDTYTYEYCDMPPGECGGICIMCSSPGSGCIGPTQCIVDSGQFTRIGTGEYEYTGCYCDGDLTANADCNTCSLEGDNLQTIAACDDTNGTGCGWVDDPPSPYGGFYLGTCAGCTKGAEIEDYEYCVDTVWNNCCTPPDDSGSGTCGDGTCSSTEDCNTCEADCGVCSGSCSTVTADIQANGSDVDITVDDDFTLSWASANADSCTLNSLSVGLNGSQSFTEQGSGDYYYEFYCQNTCGNSDTDSITVTVGCGTINADIKVNGSDGPITVDDDYTLSWTSTNADDCTLDGSAVALNDSQVETADVNGTYTYLLSCDNFCTDVAEDAVEVTVDLCGDGVCAAFENCLDCPVDCGACSTAWWQVWGGHLAAEIDSSNGILSLINDLTCVKPDCYPYLSAQDRASSPDSDGFALTFLEVLYSLCRFCGSRWTSVGVGGGQAGRKSLPTGTLTRPG